MRMIERRSMNLALTTLTNVTEMTGRHIDKLVMSRATQVIKQDMFGTAVASVILGYMENLNPTEQQEEVMIKMCQLFPSIECLEEDVRQVKWASEAMKMEFVHALEVIRLASQHCVLMKNSRKNKYTFLERVKIGLNMVEDPRVIREDCAKALQEVSQGQRLTAALLSLCDGLIGHGNFTNDIVRMLHDRYDSTEDGRRQMWMILCRITHVFVIGLSVLMTNEQLIRDCKYTRNLENDMFRKRKHLVAEKIALGLGALVNDTYVFQMGLDVVSKNIEVIMLSSEASVEYDPEASAALQICDANGELL